MALVQGGVGAEAVEVALPRDVVHPDVLAAGEDDVQGVVAVGAEALLQLDQLSGIG